MGVSKQSDSCHVQAETTSLYVGTIVSFGHLAHLFCAPKSGFSLFFAKIRIVSMQNNPYL